MNPGKNSYSLTRRNKSALLLFFFVAKLMANYTGTILPFGKTAPDANFVSEKNWTLRENANVREAGFS
jgi:hypothetical protein